MFTLVSIDLPSTFAGPTERPWLHRACAEHLLGSAAVFTILASTLDDLDLRGVSQP